MSAGDRQRVLVIDEALPHPPDSGKRIRTFELLRRLAAEFEITFAYHREGGPDAAAEAAAQDAGLHLLPVDRTPLKKHGLRFAWDLGRNLLLPVPYMVMAHRTRVLRAAVRDAVERLQPAVVHAEWTPLVANVPEGRVPVCVSAHNVETLIWERYHENEKRFARRAYIGTQVRKVRRFEQRAFRAADGVIAVSEEDAVTIRQWRGRDGVTVVPNGVDVDSFAPQPEVAVRPDELLFVGSLDWRPNLDAVTWFLDDVWGRIQAERPQARLTVVGRNPPQWLSERLEQTAGVELAGSVPDVKPYVARAGLSIVPLRIGGGSRLKISEALAMERPIVSTSVGAEGLDLGDGITLADGAEAFAAAVLRALADPAATAAEARRGRERVLATYAWDKIAPLQAAVWRSLAARSTA